MVKRRPRKRRGIGLGRRRVAFVSGWFTHTSATEAYAVKTKLLGEDNLPDCLCNVWTLLCEISANPCIRCDSKGHDFPSTTRTPTLKVLKFHVGRIQTRALYMVRRFICNRTKLRWTA